MEPTIKMNTAPQPIQGTAVLVTSSPSVDVKQSELIIQDLKNKIAKKMRREGETVEEELYTCRFKKGPISNDFRFWFTGSIDEAQLAAREYCVRFGYRFIWLDKFTVDIHAKPMDQIEEEPRTLYK